MNPNQSLGSGLGGSSFSFGAAPAFGASGATPAPAVATTTQSTGITPKPLKRRTITTLKILPISGFRFQFWIWNAISSSSTSIGA